MPITTEARPPQTPPPQVPAAQHPGAQRAGHFAFRRHRFRRRALRLSPPSSKGWTRWREARLLHQANDLLEQNGDSDAAEHTRAQGARARPQFPRRPAASSPSRPSAKTAPRPSPGGRRSRGSLPRSTASSISPPPRSVSASSMSPATALDKVAPADRDKAAYHVVAGWLSRAQGNIADEERHFAAAVAQEPKNDTYQFNLAVLQIRSPDPGKNAAARNQLERLSKVAAIPHPALRALLEHALRQNQIPAAEALAQDLADESASHLQRLPALPRSLPETEPEKIRRPARAR